MSQPWWRAWFRRGRPPRSADLEVVSPSPEVDAVEVFDASGSHQMQIDAKGLRISDLLNAAEGIVPSRPVSHEEPTTEGSRWLPLDLHATLLLIPPSRPTDARQRLHRPRQAVRLQVGPYVVTGRAHIPPGTQPTAFLLRHRRRFVPLTDAWIDGAPDERAAFSAPIVIVNLGSAESIRDAAANGPEGS
jgi:hypothetical protein